MYPTLVTCFICAVLLLWLASIAMAIWARFRGPDPTWFTYMAMAVGVAAITGSACGETNFVRAQEWPGKTRDIAGFRSV